MTAATEMPEVVQTSSEPTAALRFYLIDLDRSRVSDMAVFWRADRQGYTVNLKDAGRYTEFEASQIAARSEDCIAVECSAIADEHVQHIVGRRSIADLTSRGTIYVPERGLDSKIAWMVKA